MELELPDAKYREASQKAEFFRRMLQQVAKPAWSGSCRRRLGHLPLGGSNASADFLIEGRPAQPPGQEFEVRYRVNMQSELLCHDGHRTDHWPSVQ